MTVFIGIIHKDDDPKDESCSICFPDFPGCVSAGDDAEELEIMAHEALQFHIEGMLEDGDPLPEKPMTLEQAKKHKFAKDAAAFMFVNITLPGKPVRVNVMMDSALLQRIERVTKNRSMFLNEAAREYLKNHRPHS